MSTIPVRFEKQMQLKGRWFSNLRLGIDTEKQRKLEYKSLV